MGPIGVLCIQRTLNRGRTSGLFTGIGASISDLIYAILTGFGISMIIDFIESYELLIQIFGSIVLAGFGLYIYRQNPAKNINLKKPNATNHVQDMVSAFFLTLSNPLILFLFIGLFARFNFFLPESQFHDYITGYVSIIIGAILWWLTITYFVNKVRSKFNLRSLWIINRCIGTIIMLMSAFGFISGVIEFF
ncbi:MAG: LysE family transporter [Bacteroidales bacterium]|nr:LysE family transporter [Bacteroidales bacterium]MBQ7819674.1 LysE family transporter [Bacteroidales bacterium]